MVAWRRVFWSASTVAGAVGAVALLTDKKRTVLAQWITDNPPTVKWDYNWDRRDPKSLVKPLKEGGDENKYNEKLEKCIPSASRHVFLIRHGQYILNGASDTDRYLTDLGRVQAKLTGIRLKDLGFIYNRIVASTMTRAAESAQILSACLPDVPMESCEMLREGSPIPPEPPVGHWRPEASQFYEDGARIEAAFRKHIHRADPCQKEDSYEIMMCHANVIRYFVCRALQLPPEAWLRFSLHHCSITWLVIRPSGRVVIKTLGDSGHFPKDKLTTS